MNIPFTVEQFLDVFKNYNNSVWPFQIGLVLLALIIILLANKKSPPNKIIFSILSFFWLWMGVIYHLVYFASINKAAFIFGSVFILQGIIFLVIGFSNRIAIRFRKDLYGIVGAILIFISLIAYPVFNYVLGHIYPYSPTFGLPCPTTIFTFGLLLWAQNKVSIWVMMIPFIWSMVGFFAAFKLGIYEDTGLLAGGFITFVMVLVKNYNAEKGNARIKIGII